MKEYKDEEKIQENKNKSSSIEIDPSIHLPEESYNRDIDTRNLRLKENIENPNINNIEIPIINKNENPLIKKQLMSEIFQEIIRSPDTSEEEKEKYHNLLQLINQRKYFNCYNDIHKSNLNERILEEFEETMEKPIVLNIPETIDYDVELTKNGEKCKGLKKRFAVIKKGELATSTKPINEIHEKDKKKLKDKTKFLKGSDIYMETYNELVKPQGEWYNKKKPYRIRIDYSLNPEEVNSKRSSICLYFEDENKMKEVFIVLFGICLSEEKKAFIYKNLNGFQDIVEKGNKFYTIMKILSVKNKIKKRKKVLNKIDNAIKGKIYAQLDPIFIKKKEKEKGILKGAQKIIPPNNEKIQFEKIFSDFMPLISNINPQNGQNHIKNQGFKKDQKSLNDLIKKYNSLNDEIPNEILNQNNIELSDEGTCFKINNGIQITKIDEINNFGLMPELCSEAKYIYFDKNKPEIKFKSENNNEENSNNFNEREVKDKNLDMDILSDSNIYEISNVFLNSNINMNRPEENYLVLCGPKINNNKGISYKYINDNSTYKDPEDMNIKSKTYNIYNKEEINGITIQILQSEIDINDNKIKKMLGMLTGSQNYEINADNLKDNILFGYTIRLSEYKTIDSLYVKPKDYINNICFIEYNHQYFIPDEYLEREKNEKNIIIECFCIPTLIFSMKDIEEIKKGYIGKLLSPIKIGYVKFNLNDIRKGKYKYSIEEDDIEIPNSFLVFGGGLDSINNIKLKNINGKDYSIGSDSYLEKNINKAFINEAKNNKEIPDDVKKKYFDIFFEQNDFLLRPNEGMEESDFENELLDQISNKEQDCKGIIEKIKKNKIFHYLPYCEKYDERTLSESKNLVLSEEQKKYIRENYQEGQWIYKLPEIKVKLLSKNLGCTNNGFSQLIYSIGEKQSFPLDSLNKGNGEKIALINENNFNILNMKEISNLDNIDNFQWKTGIKFNNQLQMNSFLKLLTLARQNINTKEKNKNLNNINDFDIDKMEEFDEKKKEDSNEDDCEGGFGMGNKKCEINVEFIDFIDKINLKHNPTYLRIQLPKEDLDKKSIYSLLEDTKYGFINSLAKNEKIKGKVEIFSEKQEGNRCEFHKKVKLDKEKFNSGKKYIYLGNNLKRECDIKKNKEKLDIYIIAYNEQERYKEEYNSTINLSKLSKNKNLCIKLELPLYKTGNNEKIYGCIGIDLYEKGDDTDFEKKYIKANENYFLQPLLILKEQIKSDNNFNVNFNFQAEDYHFGLYEPNIFRRKILNFVHALPEIYVDPNNIVNSIDKELDILYEKLEKKCVKLPNRDSFSGFQFFNIKKNFDNEPNPYKRKLAFKLLKNKRHEEFMKIFREKEWDLYMKKFFKEDEGVSYIQYIENNSDKNVYAKNKDDSKALRDLIYLGIPQNYRMSFYKSFLETKKLYSTTRDEIFNKTKIDLNNERKCFSYFADKILEEENRTNLIFSLIDNDSTFLSSLANTKLEDIKKIKKIAKAFFIWAELKIGLEKNEKYVYFIGLLSIIQKLVQIFDDEYSVFWLLIGISQFIDHFHQSNPLFSEEMNYINLYGLVCKLILESHHKKIYEKFISLNFPPEFFLSKHLSSLYTDYFNDELMMRILDILIYESSFKNINNDRIQNLRVLCAIPITLIELNKNKILACESVSEINSIFNDFILHTFNHNKFINALNINIRKFFYNSNIFEKWIWFLNNKGREWDLKRGDLEYLISGHFKSVYNENKKYLSKINESLNSNTKEMFDKYYNYLNGKLKPIKSIYYRNDSDFVDDSIMTTGIMVHVCKLQQIYNNDNKNNQEYKLIVSFGNDASEIGNLEKKEAKIDFDNVNNKIKNIKDLFFKEKFEGYNFPIFIHFELTDINSNHCASFVYQILYYEPMKITKIVLENKEEKLKYFLEFVIFKYNSKNLISDDIELFNIIFGPPEYLHSISIDEKLYSYSISNYFFNRQLSQLINNENNFKNKLLHYNMFEENMNKIYKKLRNNSLKEDEYNIQYLKKTNKNVISCLNHFIQEEIKKDVIDWLSQGNISIEELLYSIVLIDKSSSTINDKLHLLYSFAQTKDKVLFGNDRLSINKTKEVIYSLYKRFMIYFTKTEVGRMIDFLLKDERLFNIKYAFVYNNKNTQKINDFIYDKDRYEPKLDNKKPFEIFFDNIDKQLNLYFNHLNNHYNLESIPKDIIILILYQILNNDKNNLIKYKKHEFNTITLVIEKDNIIFKKNYIIEYEPEPLKIVEENDSLFNFQPKNINDKEIEIVDEQLCHEISNLDIINSYSINNDISFDKFKEIFFKLPYLSDLFRVSFSYIKEDRNEIIKEFECFKVTIVYDDYMSINEYRIKSPNINNNGNINYGIFYFPKKEKEDEINNNEINNDYYEIKSTIKLTDTVDNILDQISKFLKKKENLNYKENNIINNLESINKITCFINYDLDENSKEKIGYFDKLYSCIEIKNKRFAELKILFNTDIFSFIISQQQLVSRRNGYCKIFYSDNNDFIWKKCKVKSKNITNAKLINSDYKSKPILNNGEVVLSFNI